MKGGVCVRKEGKRAGRQKSKQRRKGRKRGAWMNGTWIPGCMIEHAQIVKRIHSRSKRYIPAMLFVFLVQSAARVWVAQPFFFGSFFLCGVGQPNDQTKRSEKRGFFFFFMEWRNLIGWDSLFNWMSLPIECAIGWLKRKAYLCSDCSFAQEKEREGELFFPWEEM